MREFRAGLLRRTVTLDPWEQAIVHRDGALGDVLGPGRHRLTRRSRAIIHDLRPQILLVTGQEVLSADGIGIRVSAVAEYSVRDVRTALSGSADPESVVYRAVQFALRDAIDERAMAEVLSDRAGICGVLLARARTAGLAVGLDVSAVSLRDLTLAREVRTVLAEAALESQRSRAALERARGEVATTRALANAARILADNPGLLQLRLVQSATAGAQVVIHSGPDGTDPAR
jgi:regulator of protease activity HflC (stomatin/prohibitin superfamily)